MVAWQQCRLRDIIIAHVISADAQINIYVYIYQQTRKTQSNQVAVS